MGPESVARIGANVLYVGEPWIGTPCGNDGKHVPHVYRRLRDGLSNLCIGVAK